jgi:glutathione S-transferase
VPVLEHAGFSLYESQAILRYLDRVLPTPAQRRRRRCTAYRTHDALRI